MAPLLIRWPSGPDSATGRGPGPAARCWLYSEWSTSVRSCGKWTLTPRQGGRLSLACSHSERTDRGATTSSTGSHRGATRHSGTCGRSTGRRRSCACRNGTRADPYGCPRAFFRSRPGRQAPGSNSDATWPPQAPRGYNRATFLRQPWKARQCGCRARISAPRSTSRRHRVNADRHAHPRAMPLRPIARATTRSSGARRLRRDGSARMTVPRSEGQKLGWIPSLATTGAEQPRVVSAAARQM
jgi:hypothetical protein